MDSLAERVVLSYVELSGRLAAIVEWCVENDGECLADNPPQLAYAREILADANARRGNPLPERESHVERQPHCQAIDQQRCDYPDCPCGRP